MIKRLTFKTWALTFILVMASSVAFNQTVNTAMDVQTDTFTIEFDVTPSVAPLNAGVGVSQGDVATWGDMSSIIGFTPTGIIRTRNGSAYQQLEVMTYEAGTAYHVVMTVDVPGEKYSVVITPDGGTPTVMAYEFGFRASATEINNYFSHNDSIIAWGGVHDATLDITNFELLPEVVDIEYGIQEGIFQNIPIAPQNGRFICEFDVTPANDTIAGHVGLSNDTTKAWSDLSTIVRFNNLAMIDVRDGYNDPVYTALTDYQYWGGRTYHITMEVDVSTNKYNVTVTGDDKIPVLLAEGAEFRMNTSQLNYRVIAHDESEWGYPGSDMQVNNFSVTFQPASVKIYKTEVLPKIDGDLSDGYWDNIDSNACGVSFSKAAESDADCSGYWKAVWTEDSLYVMANITDDVLFDNDAPAWNTDGVHLYFGLANNRNGQGGSAAPPNDSTKLFNQNYYKADGTAAGGGTVGFWMAGVTPFIVSNDTGYVFEAKYEWATIDRYHTGFSAEGGTKILFDVDIVDSDNDGWWTELQWSAGQNNYNNMNDAGEVTLALVLDFSVLQAVIDSSQTVVNGAVAGYAQGEYKQNSIDAADAAIVAAEAVNAGAQTQADIDNALSTLRIEMALFTPNLFDFTELVAVIDSSQAVVDAAVVGSGNGEYTQAAVDDVNAAITLATSKLTSAFSQEAVDGAVESLRAAMALFIPTSVNNTLDSRFAMYPNPANDVLNLDNVANVRNISVYSLTGKLVREYTNADNNVSLNISGLNSGIYIIKLTTDDDSSAKRFIKE